MDNFEYYSDYQAKHGLGALEDLRKESVLIPTSGYDIAGLISEIRNETIWGEYLQGCLKTWNTASPPLFQIPNASLGLVGELLEYKATPTIDEFGDILYYRAILRYLVGDKIEIYSVKSIDDFDWFEVINLISDYSKKVVYHDKMHDIKTRNKYDKAFAMLDAFLWYQMLYVHELKTFETVFYYNLSKLSNRHQKGFNPSYDSTATL